MSTLLVFAALLLLAFGLTLYAAARSRQSVQNAALFAQLEAMDADMARFEIESQTADRELRKLECNQRPKSPRPTADSKTDSESRSTTTVPPTASPREAKVENPKRKRGLPRATHQQQIDEINNKSPEPSQTSHASPTPPIAKPIPPPRPNRFVFSLAPLKIALILIHTLAMPILRVAAFVTTLFGRKRPPPIATQPQGESRSSQNRAA